MHITKIILEETIPRIYRTNSYTNKFVMSVIPTDNESAIVSQLRLVLYQCDGKSTFSPMCCVSLIRGVSLSNVKHFICTYIHIHICVCAC